MAQSKPLNLCRVNAEENKRGRMLRGLVSRAAVSSAFPLTAGSKDRTDGTARATPNGRHSHKSPR